MFDMLTPLFILTVFICGVTGGMVMKTVWLINKQEIVDHKKLLERKVVFQFIKEQNPTIDKEMYTRLQQVIESGRNSFEADQKTLLNKRRVYETDVATFRT